MTDREKLIELIQTSPADIMGNHGIGNMADHLIANGVTVQRWIPVTERLPDAHRTYLCRYGFSQFPDYLTTGCLDWIMFDKHPHWQHESTGVFVTHWMPLPDAPKEVEDNA